MQLITWNVQWCRGVDGRVDPARIAREAQALADFDVLCLQEVARGFDGLPGSRGEDQMAMLRDALPGYRGFFATATELDDGRRRFGNAIFTRWPVLQTFRHRLPWPADPAVPSMQRVALELVLQSPAGPLRVLSTHLEYYSPRQRMTQVDALRALHAEACGHAVRQRPDGDPGEPFEVRPRPVSAFYCGDCNFAPGGAEHRRMLAPFAGDAPAFVDAWEAVHPGQPHPPSWGVHERSHPLMCCDFVFAAGDVAAGLREVTVDPISQASDHQPVLVRWE